MDNFVAYRDYYVTATYVLKNKVFPILGGLLAVIVTLSLAFTMFSGANYLAGLTEIEREPKKDLLDISEPVSGYDEVNTWILEAKDFPNSRHKRVLVAAIETAFEDGKLNYNELANIKSLYQELLDIQKVNKVKVLITETRENDDQ